MGRWRLIFGVAAAVLAAAPVWAQGLGKNLAGESCGLGAPPAAAGGARTLPIACANDERAGAVYVVPLAAKPADDPAARRTALIATARAMPGGLGRGAELRCDAGTPVAPDSDSLLFACALASNGFPRIVLLAPLGNALYQGEGLPALLPVLQAAIGEASGHALAPAETEGALRLLEQRFPGTLAHAGGADLAATTALVELARLDAAQRNYAGAEAGYRRAFEIEARLFGNSSSAVGETLMELALEVSNQGRFDEAAGLFRRAAPLIDATGSIALRARLQSYLALDAANQRHFTDALTYARAATDMRRAELAAQQTGGGTGPDAATAAPASRGELAHSLRIEAQMAMKLDDLPTALAAATEVLRIVGEEPSLPLWWRADAIAMMADINAQQGRSDEAATQYREAIVMDQSLFGDTAPTAYADLRAGRFYADQQQYAQAVAVFRRAVDILERSEIARSGITSDQIVPFLAAGSALGKSDPSQRAALDTEMFRASQLVTSDVEGRTIARAAARLASDNPALADLMRVAEDAERQRDGSRLALAAETAKSDEQRDAAREKKLAAEIEAATQRAQQVTRQIDTSFPNYARLADPGPAELDALARELGPREAFLSFVVGTKDSYALLVTRGGLGVVRVAETDTMLASDVAELRQAFQPRLGGLPDYDLAAAYELYRRLLGPIEDKLAAVDHLIVAPAGALSSLPLALLVTQKPPGGARPDYAAAAWLVRRLGISEVPSPRAFLTLRDEGARKTAAPRPLLAVADPSFTGAAQAADGKSTLGALAGTCRGDGPIDANLIAALPPLHETANEVRTVAHLLGAGDDALLLGAAATESNFRARPLDQYGVLYFATHGLLPGRAALPVRARACAVAAAADGAQHGGGRALGRERDRRAQARCRSRCAVGVQHRRHRRRRARRPRRGVLQCRRAHRRREPLGGAVALDRDADDRLLRHPRQVARDRAGAGDARRAARLDPRAGDRASLQLGRLHRDRRRRQGARRAARGPRRRGGRT